MLSPAERGRATRDKSRDRKEIVTYMRTEPFHGTWKLNIPASTLPFAAPRSVILHIEVKADRVRLTENTLSAGGIAETVNIEAKFNSETHPVIGSAIADGFTIRRANDRELETRGFKAGKKCFFGDHDYVPRRAELPRRR